MSGVLGEILVMLGECSLCAVLAALGLAHRLLFGLEGRADPDWWLLPLGGLLASLFFTGLELGAGAGLGEALWWPLAFLVSTTVLTPLVVLLAVLMDRLIDIE